MTASQKALKYGAMAFAIFLSVMIIYGIASAGIGLIDLFVGSSDSDSMMDYDKSFTGVKGLEVDTGMEKLEIRTGDQFRVVGERLGNRFTCEVRHGILTVKNENNVFGFFKSGTMNKQSKLTIYVPQNFLLDSVEIDAGVGNIEILDIHAKKMDLDMGTGNLRGSNLEIKEFVLDGGVGNTTLNHIAFDSADINAGVGNITMDPIVGKREQFNIDVDSGVGSIRIDGEQVKDDYRENKSQGKKLELDGGVGDVTIRFSESE